MAISKELIRSFIGKNFLFKHSKLNFGPSANNFSISKGISRSDMFSMYLSIKDMLMIFLFHYLIIKLKVR